MSPLAPTDAGNPSIHLGDCTNSAYSPLPRSNDNNASSAYSGGGWVWTLQCKDVSPGKLPNASGT